MQEETMDKSRSPLPANASPKSSVNDQRKLPADLQSRSNRKKDNGYKQNADSNKPAFRKPFPPRGRENVDRRTSRPRMGPICDQRNYSAAEVTNASEPVHGSNLDRNKKSKGSLNHLLNFTFSAREEKYNGWPSGVPRRQGRRSSYRSFNKEQFLQANCQFVVAESGDYRIHSADPDKLVDWSLIEQVRVFDYEVPSCPICLYPPRAARITRCGHVYCWTCILHYLSLDDCSYRSCPICYDSIHKRDLKSVRSMATHQYTVGEEITMRLMKKRKGSAVISPIGQNVDLDSKKYLLPLDAGIDTCYSKLLVASMDQVCDQIIRYERSELTAQKIEEMDDHSLEASFVELALSELSDREESLVRHKSILAQCKKTTRTPKPDIQALTKALADAVLESKPKVAENVIVYACAFSDEEIDASSSELDGAVGGGEVDDVTHGAVGGGEVDDVTDTQSPPKSCSPDMTVETVPLQRSSSSDEGSAPVKVDNKDFFYFYQATDGQQIYLHSLNARCLMREYGSLGHCPQYITGRVDALETVSMTEELRRRLRYLNHLPLTCQFKFVEMNLKPPIVSTTTLKSFEGDFESLRRQRQRKVRDEKRLSKRIDRMERMNSGLDSYDNTRIVQSAVSFTEDPALSQSSRDVASHNHKHDIDRRNDGQIIEGSDDVNDLKDIPSFASILRVPSGRAPEWPRVSSAKQQAGAPGNAPIEAGGGSDDEGLAVPSYKDAFNVDFQAALDAQTSENPDKSQSGKKKKKQKKKLLFTTTMNRAL